MHLILGYRSFCRLSLDVAVTDHPTLSEAGTDILICGLAAPSVETVDRRGMGEGLLGYLAVLDDAALGAATPVVPKFISPADPAAR